MRSVFWQKQPALRLLIPFCAGIFVQWEFNPPVRVVFLLFAVLLFATLLYQVLTIKRKFFLSQLGGLVLQFLIFIAALLIAFNNDCRNNNWFGRSYHPGSVVTATLDEPLSEKQNSYKSVATITTHGGKKTLTGKAILYLAKDSTLLKRLTAGMSLIFRKPLQEIRNSGNPGSFDYKRYCLYQGITHQVYLRTDDFLIRSGRTTFHLRDLVQSSRAFIIGLIRDLIPGKKQQGLAEALLIGYRDDLDKDLVEAYANTGVVHVIAISGLHLGIIYAILVFLTSALNRKGWYWIRFLLVIGGLWAFTFLAGAQPSVLRSAVMFSFVAAGIVLRRNGSVINSLALSALLLLCWKPQWLWDVGFQLSYTAVLSIVLFFKHVYGWAYFNNKFLDLVWKTTAVTVSAQFLTVPLTLYYFHQFPILLLLTNLVAVPLSSVILIAEILMIAISPVEIIAATLGRFIGELIRWMNSFIEFANRLPVNTWEGLQLSVVQVISLYLLISFSALWMLNKKKSLAFAATIALFIFITDRSFSFLNAHEQKKLVVYNVSKTKAADVILGRRCIFIGQPGIQDETAAWKHNVLPSRILYRITDEVRRFESDLSITVHDKTISFVSHLWKIPANTNVLVISGKLPLLKPELLTALNKPVVVLDASVPFIQIRGWKKELTRLNISFHIVSEQGAFVMNL